MKDPRWSKIALDFVIDFGDTDYPTLVNLLTNWKNTSSGRVLWISEQGARGFDAPTVNPAFVIVAFQPRYMHDLEQAMGRGARGMK